LGASFSETLFYEGTVFVEGESDIHFLETAFPDLARKYHIKDRGGRKEVEKTVLEIQDLERRGREVDPIYLIFDLDDEPTKLESSGKVKLLQWPARCIENYLIDVDILAALLRDNAVVQTPIESAGEVYKLLRSLAMEQLNQVAARNVYISRKYMAPSFQLADLEGVDGSAIGSKLFQRLQAAQFSMPSVDQAAWVSDFEKDFRRERSSLELLWEAKWQSASDGKRLISDLHKKVRMRMSEKAFKERIIRDMRDASSTNWKLMKSMIDGLFAS